MGASPSCIAAVVAASGDQLNDAEATDLIRQMEARRKRLEEDGLVDSMERRLAELGRTEGEQAKIIAALARKHAVLSARARRAGSEVVINRIMQQGASPTKALLTLLEGDANFKHSAAHRIMAFEMRYRSKIEGAIMKHRPHIFQRPKEFLRNERMWEDVTRFMYGEEPANPHADAKFLADLFADTYDLIRVDANARGANIGKLDGYAGAQVHMDFHLMNAGKEAWIAALMKGGKDGLPLLDIDRMFVDMPPSMYEEVLSDIYDNIVLGKEPKDTRVSNPFRGPPNVARALEKHRVIHFRNADSFIAYNRQFGNGNIGSNLFHHIHRMARINGLMDALGPNPGVTFDNIINDVIRHVRADESLPEAKRSSIIDNLQNIRSGPERDRAGFAGAAFRSITGQSDIPANYTLAKWGQDLRSLQSITALGGSVLVSTFTDMGTLALTMRGHGNRNLLQSFAEGLTEFVTGRGRRSKTEQRWVASLVGEGNQGLIGFYLTGETKVRFADEPDNFGRLAGAVRYFFHFNGMSGQFDATRAAGARMFAREMGFVAGKSFNQLTKRYRNLMDTYAITPEMWDIIRRTAWEGEEGARYVTPDQVEALPPEAFDSLIGRQIIDIEEGAQSKIAQLQRGLAREDRWINGRITKFEAKAARIKQQIEAIRARSGDRTSAILNAADDAIEFFDIAIAEGRAALADARDMGRAGTVQKAITLSHQGGIRRGKAEARIVRQREIARQRIRDEGKRLSAREKQLVDRIERAAADVERFLKEATARNRQRFEKIGFEETGIVRRIERARLKARDDTSLALRGFFAGEMLQAIHESSPATKRYSRASGRRGTLTGEGLGFLTQFKPFPLMFGKLTGGRVLFQRGRTRTETFFDISRLLATMFIAGYTSEVMRELVRGKTPVAPWDTEHLGALVTKSLLRSGALGIYGDFLFGEVSRFGNPPLEQAAGPTASDVGTGLSLMLRAAHAALGDGNFNSRELLEFAWQQVPGNNLFYLQAATDMLFMNALREMLDPGVLRRRDRRLQERGQERFLPENIWE